MASIIGAVVSVNSNAFTSWRSQQRPLEVHAEGPARYNPTAFEMVVPDPLKLDASSALSDCDSMFRAGSAAGGSLAVSLDIQRLVLRGRAKTGVTIVGMRAIVTSRRPGTTGTYLACPTQGDLPPDLMEFDLSKSQTSAALARNAQTGTLDDKFGNGSAITLGQNETLPIRASVVLPGDSISWHIEAQILGSTKLTIIDNHGRDFLTVGHLPLNQYEQGYRKEYDPPATPVIRHWGVLSTVSKTPIGAGERLTLGGLSIVGGQTISTSPREDPMALRALYGTEAGQSWRSRRPQLPRFHNQSVQPAMSAQRTR